jgi:hypothetical protein
MFVWSLVSYLNFMVDKAQERMKLRLENRVVVRLYHRRCHKKAKGGNIYKWSRVYFPIPAKFMKIVSGFLDKDLTVDIKVEDGNVLVIKAKRVSMI